MPATAWARGLGDLGKDARISIGGEAKASMTSAIDAGVNVAAVPALARQMLPFLQQRSDLDCPELPALWVVADTQLPLRIVICLTRSASLAAPTSGTAER